MFNKCFFATSVYDSINIVEFDKLFNASLNKKSGECYHSAFIYDNEFVDHCKKAGSRKGFTGKCFAKYLLIDIDNEDLNKSRIDTLKLCKHFYSLGCQNILQFFSGSKGFHLYLPVVNFNCIGSENFNKICKNLLEEEANKIGVKIDNKIYDKTRLFRLPNSLHPKTNLYKRFFSCKEIYEKDIETIKEESKYPRQVEVKETNREKLNYLWQEAENRINKKSYFTSSEKKENYTLFNDTISYIRHGAKEGERACRLYFAAKDLKEHEMNDNIIYDLLAGVSYESGLDEKEIINQIESGIRDAEKE